MSDRPVHYIAIIHKDPDSDFGISFPDFPGCISAGRTFKEAEAMATQALHLYLAEMPTEIIPKPSSYATIINHPDYHDSFAILYVPIMIRAIA